jgi:hypothetical protein
MATAIGKITLSASRDIPFNKPSPAAVAQAVDSEASTLSPTDALPAAPDGRTVLQLQDGLELPRAKVMAQFRIKLFWLHRRHGRSARGDRPHLRDHLMEAAPVRAH